MELLHPHCAGLDIHKETVVILRVCRPWGQLRAWVPGKQLEKVVDETTKLRPSGFAHQGIIRGGSAQSDTVDPLDDSVSAINVSDMRTKTGAG
jgi:hypothetical protein